MPLVIFSPNLQSPPRTSEQSYSGVRLTPGQNTLSDRQWDLLQSNPSARADIARGAIALITPMEPAPEQEDPPTLPGDLNEYSTKEALPLIEGQEDPAVLRYWEEVENGRSNPRSTILKAIAAQLDQLTKEIQ